MACSNLRIAQKVLCLVVLMLAFTGIVAAVGVHGVRALSNEIHEVKLTAHEALTGARATRDAVYLNRAELRLAADPRAETLREVVEAGGGYRRAFEDRLRELRATADGEQARLLAPVEEAWRRYLAEFEDTVAAARRHGAAVVQNDASRAITDSAIASRTSAETLIDVANAYNGYTARKAERIAERADALGARLTTVVIAVAALGTLAGLVLGWLTGTRAIARPVSAAVARLKALADGDTEGPIAGADRRDEVGDISRTLSVFRDSLLAARERQAAELREAEAKALRARRVEEITRAFEEQTGTVVRGVAAAATELEATATGMAAGAEETSRQASTVAAAAEELAASVNEISRQVAESTRIAADAVREAERTGTTVRALSDTAQRISEVVRLISEIAGQTNLLALNATIEAARAGEAGKGFAVVASEVKTLAAQTGRATEEIAGQVSAVQAETGRVVEAIRGMGEVIGRLSAIATSIAAAVEEQGAATGEIARNVQEASAGTASVTTSIASVNEAAAGSGAAASQVTAAARDLSRGAETLRTQVDRFLAEMKAA